MSDANPNAGDVVTVSATFYNQGNLPAENVIASFFAGDPADGGVYLGSDYFANVAVGGSAQTSVTWDTTGYDGEVEIFVILDAAEQLAELNEDNNFATIIVDVTGAVAPPPDGTYEIYLPLTLRSSP